MSAEELRLELDELRQLEGLAKRPRVQSLLANEIRNVEAKVASSPSFSFLFFSFFFHPFSSPHFLSLPVDPIRLIGGFRFDSIGPRFAMSDCDVRWQLAKATAPAPEPQAAATAAPARPGLNYVTLGSFSWDQDNDKIRVRCS